MAVETRIRLVKNFAKMTVRLFLHFFDLQRRHDDRMPCITYSVSSVFAPGDMVDRPTGLMKLFAIPPFHAATPWPMILFWKPGANV